MSPDDIAVKHLKHMGRMISGSKSGYLHQRPKNVVFFNANVYNHEGIKIWYGDLDLTVSEGNLKALAGELGQPIYVTHEQPYRWGDVTVKQLEAAAAETSYPSVYKYAP